MKVTWIHGVRRLRGVSMDKWVDGLRKELEGAPGTDDLEIVVDEIKGIATPWLRGIINRYFLYSLHCSRLRSDLFHIHDHANAHLVRLLPKATPKIVTVHDLYMLEQPLSSPASYPFRLFNSPGIKKADHIITVSAHMKGEIVRRLGYEPERISVIYCGIDNFLYHPENGGGGLPARYSLAEGKRYVLFVGSEIQRKNFPMVLEAFRGLADLHDDLYLLKVGNPGSARDRERSLHRIGELGLEERVVFCGFVPEKDLPRFYQNAELLLAPSLYEGGSGIHVIEAMACGCPVIASSIPQSVELVAGAAIHANPNDSQDILEKARVLLENEGLRREMIERGLIRSREFSWKKSAREHLDVYRLFSA